VQQRTQALLDANNFWEAARDLARRFFTAALPGGELPAQAPRVVLRRRGAGLRARVERLWELAQEEEPSPFPAAAWDRLLRTVQDLRAALADGSMTLHA
jgi:hypothetical protein